ncbi:PASTA domain-containing protein [Solirubrobacter sp. CPCC 204708]|uniref:PASTA domain-containing protein n=1 Tax=Solirubrobacter deserti TaxID=2282478 RepID=A0ABT4RNK5_9ACTN|nr:PASTA domain-containing protein [Solirubrobacter deserti]MBE2314926.1 PASTA domain-containing protein [Solirubrobacter deserti]MDA0140157.1 PASTA domain-containing protein [Solirubrobacter deserti]
MRALVLLLAAGLLVAGCGDEPRATANPPRVTLKLTTPDDGGTTFEDRVEVRGTVSPADSAVLIAGESAEVDAGEFHAEVPLDPGANIIDVSASSTGRRPATDAVRVTRDMRVRIPELVGLEFDQAADALGKLGLKAVEEQGGSWLDRVIPGISRVCAVDPVEGTLVDRRSTVTLLTQRDC